MKIIDIRQRIAEQDLDRPNCRDAARDFLRSFASKYEVMGTLTLKQRWYDKCGAMRVDHFLRVDDIPSIYARFEDKLNKRIWKKLYSRHGSQRLNMLKAWEDGNGTKRLHLHFLLGNLPTQGFKLSSLRGLIEEAARQCYEIDIEHEESLCDDGAIDYITKEVGKHDTDKILW